MIKNIKKARFESRVNKLLEERHNDKYQMLQSFAGQSDSFAQLRENIVDHYFARKQLGAIFCADALVLLVDRVLKTVEQDVQTAQAA